MRLQLKVTLAMFFAVAMIVFMTSAVLWYIVFPSYLDLEEDEARRNVERVHSVIDEDIASLARAVTDWAVWDDTYRYVANQKPSFIEDNLAPASVANLNISILYAEDAAGRPVLTAAYDQSKNTVDTTGLDIVNGFASASRLVIKRAWADGQASGLVFTDAGLFMVAAHGTQPSDRNAPANGILVFGRAVDEAVTDSIRRRVRLPITFDALTRRDDTSIASTPSGSDFTLSRTDATVVAASVLRDIDQGPLMVFRTEMPRSIVLLGGKTLSTAAMSLVLSAIMILFLLWVALRMIIVRPIQNLTKSLALAEEAVSSAPVERASGADEIGTLALVMKRHVELQRALAEASAARKVAEEANRVKSLFLAQMSHELRTPLHAILGFSEIMDQKLFGPLNDTYQDYAARIHKSGAHLLNLINDILDISKVEAGEFKVTSELIDVTSTLKDCIRMVCELPTSNGLTIRMDIPAGLPMLRADARRLRQVLLNLLSNAVKFTPEGGRVVMRAAVDQTGLVLSVQDTGIGIASEHLETVLEPFGQIDNTLTRKYEGTGLGLPLAKELARLMGATLTIASTVGIGTTVTIAFPAERLVVPQR